MAKSKKSKDSLFDLDLSFDEEKESLPEINIGDTVNGVVVTGNYENDLKGELSETLRRFKDSASAETNLKSQNTNTEYWFATYFANQEQRDLFLTALGLLDKLKDQYIDGHSLAEAVGIKLPNDPITPPKRFRGLGKNQSYDIFE